MGTGMRYQSARVGNFSLFSTYPLALKKSVGRREMRKCLFCRKPTNNVFIVWSYFTVPERMFGKYDRGTAQGQEEAGKFSCCIPCELRTRSEIDALRIKR